MSIFFTSDNHFFHKNIMKFCPTTRFGESVGAMNNFMIQRWNQQVKPTDHVYCLGDFSFGTADETYDVICRLNGLITLVYGNHDKVIRNNEHIQDLFTECVEYKEIRIDGKTIVMSHYPMREWNKMHHGSIHLFGHVHGGLDHIEYGKSMDVGIDTRDPADMGLWSWEEIEEKMSGRPVLEHSHK
ncbi:metallophosphoesterase [Ralstonia phage RSP15]|uniref:phosphoesterase n=1 Tax=Ralstonia phage RSP15 TaxID=1785960 RepID=UPI00074D409F|nr:phosphoesterase [Ralstonia phage RSP15]BAU40052.1 metallophosphoesterase [Ralstonia phage RSP15]